MKENSRRLTLERKKLKYVNDFLDSKRIYIIESLTDGTFRGVDFKGTIIRKIGVLYLVR